MSILGIIFGSLLLDRPESFADQKHRENADRELAEERQILFDDLDNKNENIKTDHTIHQTKITIPMSDNYDDNSDEDDNLESLLEYSEENIDEFKVKAMI